MSMLTPRSSTNIVPAVAAGIVALVVLVAIIAVVARRGATGPQPLVLGVIKDDTGSDWENPIYVAPARSVAFDNPIYDRLDNMV